jgi:3D (Asp-Asp-Asp) domain-containing protein
MRRLGSLLAIAALAVGCQSAAPRAPAPTARVAPAGECANAPEHAPEPPAPPPRSEQRVAVTATAYNSLSSQGVGKGQHGAWGDRLAPGMNAIAVSHDLLALGLARGSVVRIEGLPGEFVVLDRLPRRWHRRIDIYMGRDVRAARRWGQRMVEIRWDQNVGDGSELTSHIAK